MIDSQKQAPGSEQLHAQAYAFSLAIAQVLTGDYPPDFLESVMEGGQDSFRTHFAEVSKVKGATQTRHDIRQHMIGVVNTWVDARYGIVMRDQLKPVVPDQVDAVLTQVLSV